MTTYAKSIDLTENQAHGCKFTATVGTGGVTAGYAVKWDGTNANTVVLCDAAADYCIGIARDTVAANGTVTVLGDGCLVKVPATITVGARVGITAVTGLPCTWGSDTLIGTCDTSATLASIIRVKTDY